MTRQGTRRRGGTGLLAALTLLLSGFLVAGLGAGSAHADSVSMTVSKTTGLNPDGEKVTVAGKGFIPGINLFLTVCDPAKPAGQACDGANYKMVPVDAAGGFVAEITAVAKFGSTDCLVTPCAFQTSRVGMGKDRTQEAVVPIGFTGGVPPTLPTRPQENAGPPGAGAPGAASSAPASTPAPAPASPGAAASDKSDESDDDSSAGLIIGVVAGAVVVVGAGAFFFLRRRGTASS